MKSLLAFVIISMLGAGTVLAQILAEPQIAKLMKTANEGEIDAAKLAKKRANNAQVKAFAEKMMEEHKKNEKEMKKIAKSKDIDMDKSDASKQLKEMNKTTMKNLKDKKDAEFDKAYMDSQVEMHQSLLNQIEGQFLPAAQTPEFKDYLTKTRDHVKMHLDEAKSIQSSLQ